MVFTKKIYLIGNKTNKSEVSMGTMDPKLIALQFNRCINSQNIHGISNLMTEDHRFIDRAGMMVSGKESMTSAWIRFFELFP
jgi:hypothetical protein